MLLLLFFVTIIRGVSGLGNNDACGGFYCIEWNYKPHQEKTLALTFDDGPDPLGFTDAVVDALNARNIMATFFVNTRNICDLRQSTAAQRALQRIHEGGHVIASHTAHHWQLSMLTDAQVEAEIADVEEAVKTIVPEAPPLTLLRAPYGDPYFGPLAQLERVGSIVARHAVHIGWQIDSEDWKCAALHLGAECVVSGAVSPALGGQTGLVLMHSIHKETAAALPAILDRLVSAKFRFVTAEDLVRDKYGKSSKELVQSRAALEG